MAEASGGDPLIQGLQDGAARAGDPEPRGVIAVDKVGNKIRFYDPVTFEETKVLDGPEPTVHQLAVAPDRSVAYVPLYGDGIYGNNKNPNNKVLVIDLARREIADVIDLGRFLAPHGMVVTRDGSLWVVCDITGVLLRLDPATRSVAEIYECPGKGPHLVTALPDETKLYVSNKEAGLSVFDVGRRAFSAAIAVGNPDVPAGNGSGSEGMGFTPDGRHLVVVDNDRSDLRIVDTDADRLIDRVPLDGHPPTNIHRSRLAQPRFAPDGGVLMVTSYATGMAWVLDGQDLRRQTPVAVAKGPMGILFMPDGGSVLVSSHDSGLLTRIDIATAKVIEAYDGGAGIEVMEHF